MVGLIRLQQKEGSYERPHNAPPLPAERTSGRFRCIGVHNVSSRPGKSGPDNRGNLIDLSATEAVSLLRSGALSAERYAQALLNQCRKHRALNAFIWQNEDQVLEAARAADR